jgi:hypothetical protein
MEMRLPAAFLVFRTNAAGGRISHPSQISRAMESRCVPQCRFLDARVRRPKGKRPLARFLQHGRREQVPSAEQSAAQQIQGKIEGIHQRGESDTERFSVDTKIVLAFSLPASASSYTCCAVSASPSPSSFAIAVTAVAAFSRPTLRRSRRFRESPRYRGAGRFHREWESPSATQDWGNFGSHPL